MKESSTRSGRCTSPVAAGRMETTRMSCSVGMAALENSLNLKFHFFHTYVMFSMFSAALLGY
jgi:hypothetical protein